MYLLSCFEDGNDFLFRRFGNSSWIIHSIPPHYSFIFYNYLYFKEPTVGKYIVQLVFKVSLFPLVAQITIYCLIFQEATNGLTSFNLRPNLICPFSVEALFTDSKQRWPNKTVSGSTDKQLSNSLLVVLPGGVPPQQPRGRQTICDVIAGGRDDSA